MNISEEKLRKRIRNAGIAGVVLTILTLLTCISSAQENQTITFSLWGQVLVSLILTIWIFKGSRLAATWMAISFTVNKVAGYWIFKPSPFDIVFVIILWVFVQGARAAFEIRRAGVVVAKGTDAALGTADRKQYSWFAVASFVVVLVVSLSPVMLLKRYLETRPGRFPLLLAVVQGDSLKIEQLVEQGYDVNQTTPLGTPLSVAASAGRPEIIELLISRGADPAARDWKEWSPLHSAILPEVARLEAIVTLVENGADVNVQDGHLRTPLHRAAQFGHVKAVELLLQLGARPDAKDENGWTPADRAEKNPEITAILRQASEKPRAPVPIPATTHLVGTEVYIDPNYGFSIEFPKDWEVKKPVTRGTAVIKANYTPGGTQNFATLVIYVAKPEDGADFSVLTGKQFFDAKFAGQAELLDSGETTLSGHRAIWFKLRFLSGGKSGMGYAVSYVVVRSNAIFTLWGHTVAEKQADQLDWFRQNEAKILAAIRTFRPPK